jgi:hypothetical protein
MSKDTKLHKIIVIFFFIIILFQIEKKIETLYHHSQTSIETQQEERKNFNLKKKGLI